ncbi:MAG: adenylate/guanylate cyclase domain-containing protein [Myxococcales bacterium]|jgi:class 3 adenylate cyclase
MTDLNVDLETLSLTDIIRLQNQLSQVLSRKFERRLALGFSDIVGSTPYFARFGDQAGRKLQQRHTDLLQTVLSRHEGRIVDTAGDGAFTCFPGVDQAAKAFMEVHALTANENISLPPEHHLSLRMGIHFGPVLTDGVVVTGDAVNLCSRVAGSANPGTISLTSEAFREIADISLRLKCSALPPTPLKGIDRPIDLMRLEWRDASLFPTHVRIEETDEVIQLPDQPTIGFGRLAIKDGIKANDVVLTLPDEEESKKISRWHFELRRHATGFVLRALTSQVTEVDGKSVGKGEEMPIKVGSVVNVARAMSLRFISPGDEKPGEQTVYEQTTMFV